MRFLLIDGAAGPGPLDQVVTRVRERLFADGHPTEVFRLREMDIRQCVGCWDCWVKSPGRCRLPDDQEGILRRVLEVDCVVFAAPLVMGYPAALLKRCVERFIPLLHPYITLLEGECHHRKRYANYPDLALLLEREADTDDEDLDIVRDLFARCALNFHGELRTLNTTDQPIEEVCNALARA